MIFLRLTDVHGGESLRRLPVQRGDLVLVDRAYNDHTAMRQMLCCGAAVIMRYHSSAFPLLDKRGRPFDPLPSFAPLAHRRDQRVGSALCGSRL